MKFLMYTGLWIILDQSVILKLDETRSQVTHRSIPWLFCPIPHTSQVILNHYKPRLLPQSKEERNRGVQTTRCPTSQIFTPSGIGGDGSHVILSPLRVQGISCKPNSVSNHFQPCNSVNIISKMSSFMDSIMCTERRWLIFSALGCRNESPITSTWSNVLHYCKCAPLSKAPSLAATKHWDMPPMSLGDSLIQHSW